MPINKTKLEPKLYLKEDDQTKKYTATPIFQYSLNRIDNLVTNNKKNTTTVH